jgi:hypothetical protein
MTLPYDLDEFEKIAIWLQDHLAEINGTVVENVRFNMKWFDELYGPVFSHSKGFNGACPMGKLSDTPPTSWSGFYGYISLDVLTRTKGTPEHDPYLSPYRDLFEPLAIHQINQSYQYSGGRIKNGATDNTVFTIEQTERFKCCCFLFGSDWPELTDSIRVRNLLTA